MYGQMTAGSWIYIGSQGIVQGTYETYAEVARRHFGGSLKNTLNVTAGLGGMGGAQPAPSLAGLTVSSITSKKPTVIQRAKMLLRVVTLLNARYGTLRTAS